MKKKTKKKVKHPNGLEFYKDATGHIRWRVWKNGREIDGATEGFKRIAGAVNNYLSGLVPGNFADAIAKFKAKNKTK